MCTRRMPVDICVKIAIPATGDHLPRGDTLAPNRQCPLVAGTTVHQTNCSSRHKGSTWGVLGGQQFNSLGKLSDWHQLWFTSADSSGNGHRLNTSRPSIPHGAFRGGGGGVRVSQIQKSWEAVKRLDRLAPKLSHICRSIWEWIYAKQIAPRDTSGHLGVLGVKHSKVWGAVKRLDRFAPTLVHVCGFIWEWT